VNDAAGIMGDSPRSRPGRSRRGSVAPEGERPDMFIMDQLPEADRQQAASLADYIMDTCDRITINNRMTVSELEAFLPKHPFTLWLGSEGRMRAFDYDHDGCLSLEELQIACAYFLRTRNEQELSPIGRTLSTIQTSRPRPIKEARSPFMITARDKANALLMNSGYVGGFAFDQSGLVKKYGGAVLQTKGMHKLTKTALDDITGKCKPFQRRNLASQQAAARANPLTVKRKTASRFIPPEMSSPAERAAHAVSREEHRWRVTQSRQQQQAAKEWSKAEFLRRAQELPVLLTKQERDSKQDVAGLEREVRDLLQDADIPIIRRQQIESELSKLQRTAPGTARRLQVWLEYLNTKVADDDDTAITVPMPSPLFTTAASRNKQFDVMRTQDQELWPVSLSRDIHNSDLATDSIGTVNYTTSVSDTGMETHNIFGTSPLPAQIFTNGFCHITNY